MTARVTRSLSLGLAFLLAAGATASALEVELQVTETEQIGRKPAVVTTGVPFARGAVRDTSRLSVAVAGRAVPSQFTKIAPWEDGSVRWALTDVQVDVPAGGKAALTVSDRGSNPPPPAPVRVDDADTIRVSTGPLQFTVNRRKFNLFESLKVDGRELVTSAGKGLVIYKEGGGEALAGPPTSVTIEQAGPLRAIVCLKGRFPGLHKDLLGYTVRVTAFAGSRFVKVHVWIENGGAMGYHLGGTGDVSPNAEWFAFDGMAVELGLGLGDTVIAKCEEVHAAGNLKVYQFCHQARGQEKAQHKKGPFYTWTDFQYNITSAGKLLKTGDRTDGVLALKGGGGTLVAAIRGFWQNYEKAIELDGKTLKLWLWPTEGQWPRVGATAGEHERTLPTLVKPGLYVLPGSIHKGHEFLLDFSGRDAKEAAAELSAPLWALAQAEHYAATEAAPGLFAPPGVRTGNKTCDIKLAAWERMLRSAADPENPNGLFQARKTSFESGIRYAVDSTYWFGWMDYGDITLPGRGPVGLHYDWTGLMLLGAMRTGDMSFVRLASAMARHRVDVDQLWSDRDLIECRGLQRGNNGLERDGTLPSFHCGALSSVPDVRVNFLAGVALYYMLSGEPKALECCLRNAEGIKGYWAWAAAHKSFYPRYDPRGDLGPVAWSIAAYCALYDMTGQRQWLGEALGLFNTYIGPLWKRFGPHLHDPADQIRGQDYQYDDAKYCYAIAPLCELHRLTGDGEVLRLLKEGCEKPFPESYYDAPIFLADLYAYVGLQTANEATMRRAARLFAQGFPESMCPPVYLPDNSVWSRTSAMTLRAGHLLQHAYWKQNEKKR